MKQILFVIVLIIIQPLSVVALTVSDYLIDTDIGQYLKSYPGACPYGSGVVAGAGHFKLDHKDNACEIRYYDEALDLGVEVQVTQHVGSESDKWLLHEVERGFRDTDNLEASSAEDTMIRVINSNNIFFYGGGIVGYRWVSNNLVVNIQYTNLSGPKPEPLEVVQAYLAKFPSTIPAITLDQSHSEQWIKDEMDRRLWLCDKWVEQNQTGTVDVAKLVRKMHDHMKVFLNYKKKYYGIDTDSEKIAIYEYMQAKDEALMKSKLAEYKTWWTSNKDGEITLP